jgi:Transposase DDE domain
MEHTSELSKTLNETFHWNKARIKFFVKMLMALLTTRTVNLDRLADGILSNTEKASRYRRLQRFFSLFQIDFEMIAGFIFKLFFVGSGKWYLTMDRTNWQWGKSNINILTLAIAYKGIAIQIYWELLDKKGNSDSKERIDLITKFINKFGKDCIAGILADREFVGEDWFSWLIEEKIFFYIRIKKNFLTTDSRGREVYVYQLFRGIKPTEERVLYGKRSVLGSELYVSALKLPDGELLIVATNDKPGLAIKTYALRWEIETLFSCLKSRGFDFEKTHITNQERIKKLFVLLAIAFCWAHKVGEWRHEQKPLRIKKHGRLEKSLFRYGLDYIIDAIQHLFGRKFADCLDKIRFAETDLNIMEHC